MFVGSTDKICWLIWQKSISSKLYKTFFKIQNYNSLRVGRQTISKRLSVLNRKIPLTPGLIFFRADLSIPHFYNEANSLFNILENPTFCPKVLKQVVNLCCTYKDRQSFASKINEKSFLLVCLFHTR